MSDHVAKEQWPLALAHIIVTVMSVYKNGSDNETYIRHAAVQQWVIAAAMPPYKL